MAIKIKDNVKVSLREDFGKTDEEICKNILKLVSSGNYFKCDDIVFDPNNTDSCLAVYTSDTILIVTKGKSTVTELKVDVNKILDKSNCYISKIRRVGSNIKVMIACPVEELLIEKYKCVGYKDFAKALNFGSVPGMLVTYIDITEILKESNIDI